MARGDLPPQGGCDLHGSHGCTPGSHEQRPVEAGERRDTKEASLAKLGELTDVHQQIVELLREKFAPQGVRQNPLGQGKFTMRDSQGQDREVTYSDSNSDTQGGSVFRVSAPISADEAGQWQLDYLINVYRGQPETGRSYPGSIKLQRNGKVVTDIGLDFSYGATTKSGQDLPLKKERPKLRLVGGDRLIGIKDNGINLTTGELLRWENDFGTLQDHVLQHELIQKTRVQGTSQWDEEVISSVRDLRRIWEEARTAGLLGKLRYKSFEEQFPEARNLGEKPSPSVMSHQEFQTGIQSMRKWMEHLREGIRNQVGVATSEVPPPLPPTVQAPKVSLARRPALSEQPSQPPPEPPPKGRISLAKPRKPLTGR